MSEPCVNGYFAEKAGCSYDFLETIDLYTSRKNIRST